MNCAPKIAEAAGFSRLGWGRPGYNVSTTLPVVTNIDEDDGTQWERWLPFSGGELWEVADATHDRIAYELRNA